MDSIEFFSDVTCPFAYVGVRRLLELRDQRGAVSVPTVSFRAWPLEWVNGSPLGGDAVAERVAALRTQVAPELFVGFDPDNFPTTSIPAMALTSRAYGIEEELGESIAIALRAAIFERGIDISKPDVLAAIASDHGVNPDGLDELLVRAEYERGQALGVEGSPHVFFDGTGEFCPLLNIEKSEGGFHITENRDRLAALLGD